MEPKIFIESIIIDRCKYNYQVINNYIKYNEIKKSYNEMKQFQLTQILKEEKKYIQKIEEKFIKDFYQQDKQKIVERERIDQKQKKIIEKVQSSKMSQQEKEQEQKKIEKIGKVENFKSELNCNHMTIINILISENLFKLNQLNPIEQKEYFKNVQKLNFSLNLKELELIMLAKEFLIGFYEEMINKIDSFFGGFLEFKENKEIKKEIMIDLKEQLNNELLNLNKEKENVEKNITLLDLNKNKEN